MEVLRRFESGTCSRLNHNSQRLLSIVTYRHANLQSDEMREARSCAGNTARARFKACGRTRIGAHVGLPQQMDQLAVPPALASTRGGFGYHDATHPHIGSAAAGASNPNGKGRCEACRITTQLALLVDQRKQIALDLQADRLASRSRGNTDLGNQ